MIGIGRILNCAGRLILDPQFQSGITKSLRVSGRNLQRSGASKFSKFGKQLKDAFVYADKHTGGAKNSFFKDMGKLITSTPKELNTAWKSGSGFFSKCKALGKPLAKRVPLLGNALLLAFELPNICSAFKEEGLTGGLKETGKAGAKLAAASAGAAIGTALFPGAGSIIGGIIGWTAGEWLMSKIVGKSYTEKKEEQLAQSNQMQNQSQMLDESQYTASNLNALTQNQGQMQDMSTALDGNNLYPSTANMSMPFPQPTLTPAQLQLLKNQLYGYSAGGWYA